jgi:hypothetical protein
MQEGARRQEGQGQVESLLGTASAPRLVLSSVMFVVCWVLAAAASCMPRSRVLPPWPAAVDTVVVCTLLYGGPPGGGRRGTLSLWRGSPLGGG